MDEVSRENMIKRNTHYHDTGMISWRIPSLVLNIGYYQSTRSMEDELLLYVGLKAEKILRTLMEYTVGVVGYQARLQSSV